MSLSANNTPSQRRHRADRVGRVGRAGQRTGRRAGRVGSDRPSDGSAQEDRDATGRRGGRRSDRRRAAAVQAGPIRRPERSLPSGRAALGGLLVTIAALGTLLAYGSAHSAPKGRFLVATRDVAAGAPLGRSDVRVARFDLPPDLAERVADASAQSQFTDLVTLAPIRAGEPILRANLIRKSGGATSREMSVSLDSAQAAGGHLQIADRVDVLATFGSGTDARTELVAADLPIVRLDRADGSITSSRAAMTITLAFDDPALELSMAQAIAVGKVQLVRTTGAAARSQASPTSSPSSPPTAPLSNSAVAASAARKGR